MRPFAVYQLPLILYAALIFVVSSLSGVPTPDLGIESLDKLAHFIEYFIFLLLAYRAFSGPLITLKGIWAYLLAVIFSILFAITDEYHQSFVAGRQADIYDLISDSCGIILAALLLFLLHKRRQ